MSTKVVDKIVYRFNTEDNGGESFSLVTEVHQDERRPEDKFLTQEIVQECYGRSTTISMPLTFTPERLRELANLLDKKMNEHCI